MPDFLETAVGGAAARTRVAPRDGGFSLVEHIWHLADLEREGYGERIARLREGRRPFLRDFDGERLAREREYARRDLEPGLAQFREWRARNIKSFRGLTAAEWELSGTQENVGPLLLRNVPRLMLDHDRSHRKEIRELLENARP